MMDQSVSTQKVPQNKKIRPPPQVRQTLTSKYRMLKANPLLVHELKQKINTQNKEEFVIPRLKTLVTVLDSDTEVLSKLNISCNTTQTSFTTQRKNLKRCESNKEISKREFVHPLDVQRKKNPLQCAPKSLTASVDRNLNVASTSGQNMKNLQNGSLLQKTNSIRHLSKNNKPSMPAQLPSKQDQHKELKTQQNTLTKLSSQSSSSANRKSIPVTPNAKSQFLNSTCAARENMAIQAENIRSTLSPAFAAGRNSLFNTPNRRSIFVSKQTSNEVTQKLSEWLKHRGKSFKEYHHLKCFGVHAASAAAVEEKENLENSVPDNNNSVKETVTLVEEVDFSVVAKEALIDLHKLILDGYPAEQCEVWLKLVKQKCRQVEEEPEYWECRAALEQTKGNINLAVECYKTAIIQGAEVQNVDKCLDQLLQKFSLLNINETDSCVNKASRNKIVQDARNVFKSSIIQFAVQEKVLKKKSKEGITIEKRVVATPVRRSTRLSRSAFTSTPGIHIYSSLQEIDTSVRDRINFECNIALKD